ncbi:MULTISPECIES: MFS transporter [Pseudomonas]|uniref:MFS family arabinose efflux permease n=1 Tax=Pseudomonas hunanensis TaxID=1247546 RepID=A0ACC6K5T1_9PSED|nr:MULTISPECIES: MFS transporter [Pseudomonas]MBP2261901.1 putative MFS family arabinose efflux permease [Pseudomonas sp. BP8]MDR6713783.1 putative MFS family arabinose efflux permease [Pseudomonas hunanensis]HDS1734701.1 MFS transporter [Pseudomonas putida]
MNPSIAVTQPSTAGLSRALVTLLAFCCGAIVANIYYAQPIVGLIAPDLGLSSEHASLIVSLTQLGYAVGLLLLVPLADLVENRRLMIATAIMACVSLVLAGTSGPGQGTLFLGYALLIGFSSVSVQMLIPLAAHLAPEQQRGRVVGNIMGGLLLGILLARPLSSLVADHFGWRTVFIGAAGVMLAIIVLLALTLPRRVPEHKASYAQLMASLVSLLKAYPLLRQRSLYQALMFGAFSLYWTAVPMALAGEHGLSQSQIALFALVGAVGAVAAPLAGRLADAGHARRGSLLALVLAPLALLLGLSAPGYTVIGLGLTGVLLDFAVQMNMVIGQREVYALDPASRGRLNALYMTSIFLGGALGSAVASPLYTQFGWHGVALVGAGLPVVALGMFLMVLRRG